MFKFYFSESPFDIPTVVEPPANATIVVGDPAFFVCRVSQINESNISWYKRGDDGQLIQLNNTSSVHISVRCSNILFKQINKNINDYLYSFPITFLGT